MSDYRPSMGGMRKAYHRWAIVNENVVAPSELDAEFDRFIAKIKADERQSLLEELTADSEHEARIGEQGNDSERVNAAEKIIEMLNDIQIEREA